MFAATDIILELSDNGLEKGNHIMRYVYSSTVSRPMGNTTTTDVSSPPSRCLDEVNLTAI